MPLQSSERQVAIGKGMRQAYYTTLGTGILGFAAQENPSVAVCVLPGTELVFDWEVEIPGRKSVHRTAIFRQVNKNLAVTHHDALEFPDGRRVLLTRVCQGQHHATVLQLPSVPTTEAEKEAQTRVKVVALGAAEPGVNRSAPPLSTHGLQCGNHARAENVETCRGPGPGSFICRANRFCLF